jgi:hypothetical protein
MAHENVELIGFGINAHPHIHAKVEQDQQKYDIERGISVLGHEQVSDLRSKEQNKGN